MTGVEKQSSEQAQPPLTAETRGGQSAGKDQKASSCSQPCLLVPSHTLGGTCQPSKHNMPYNTVITWASIDFQGLQRVWVCRSPA